MLMMFELSSYLENGYTTYRSVILKNTTLGTVDKTFLNKLPCVIFFIFLITKLWSHVIPY